MLAQMPIGNQADMETAAVQLAKDYGTCVLVKGGHGVKDADDVLAFPTGAVTWFEGNASPTTTRTAPAARCRPQLPRISPKARTSKTPYATPRHT